MVNVGAFSSDRDYVLIPKEIRSNRIKIGSAHSYDYMASLPYMESGSHKNWYIFGEPTGPTLD